MKSMDILQKTVVANKITQEILKADVPVRGEFTIEVKVGKGEVKDIKILIEDKE